MRARKERAVAHEAVKTLTERGSTMDRWTFESLLRVVEEFTQPRPWWRFW